MPIEKNIIYKNFIGKWHNSRVELLRMTINNDIFGYFPNSIFSSAHKYIREMAIGFFGIVLDKERP